MKIGRPITDKAATEELLMEIEASALNVIEDVSIAQPVREKVARIADLARCTQGVISGQSCGDKWFREYLLYMLGGEKGGEF